MKSLVINTALISLVSSSLTWADTQHLRIEAPVVSVSEMVRTVTDKIPHRSCWDETVRVEQRGHRSGVTPVLGAIIGGAVGGALGDNTGHQKEIATAGAVLGAVVGHDASHQRGAGARYVTEQRCEIDYELRDREIITGYRVGYEYGGEVYYTKTQQRPGPTISVGVILEPASY